MWHRLLGQPKLLFLFLSLCHLVLLCCFSRSFTRLVIKLETGFNPFYVLNTYLFLFLVYFSNVCRISVKCDTWNPFTGLLNTFIMENNVLVDHLKFLYIYTWCMWHDSTLYYTLFKLLMISTCLKQRVYYVLRSMLIKR